MDDKIKIALREGFFTNLGQASGNLGLMGAGIMADQADRTTRMHNALRTMPISAPEAAPPIPGVHQDELDIDTLKFWKKIYDAGETLRPSAVAILKRKGMIS